MSATIKRFEPVRDSFPWRLHLTLREVKEYEDLAFFSTRILLKPGEQRRMADLGSRRVRVPVEAEADGAA